MRTTSHGNVIAVGCSVQGIQWARLMFWLAVLLFVVGFWVGGIAGVVALLRVVVR